MTIKFNALFEKIIYPTTPLTQEEKIKRLKKKGFSDEQIKKAIEDAKNLKYIKREADNTPFVPEPRNSYDKR